MNLPLMLTEHARWLEGLADGVRANLQDANLESVYLQDANLEGADLRGADLRGANLKGANLEGVNLWVELRKKVELFVEASKTCGKLIVVLAHYKEPKLDKSGNLIIGQNLDAPGKIGGYVCSEADLIGACSKSKVGNKMQFKVSFVGGGEVGAYGGRVKELEGKEVILPEDGQWAAIVAASKAPVKSEPPKAKTAEKDDKTAGKAAPKGVGGRK